MATLMDVPTTAQLVATIEEFLGRHGGMAPSRFGREATGEPQLLDSLRRGRSPSLDTTHRIVAFMKTRDAELIAHESAEPTSAAA